MKKTIAAALLLAASLAAQAGAISFPRDSNGVPFWQPIRIADGINNAMYASVDSSGNLHVVGALGGPVVTSGAVNVTTGVISILGITPVRQTNQIAPTTFTLVGISTYIAVSQDGSWSFTLLNPSPVVATFTMTSISTIVPVAQSGDWWISLINQIAPTTFTLTATSTIQPVAQSGDWDIYLLNQVAPTTFTLTATSTIQPVAQSGDWSVTILNPQPAVTTMTITQVTTIAPVAQSGDWSVTVLNPSAAPAVTTMTITAITTIAPVAQSGDWAVTLLNDVKPTTFTLTATSTIQPVAQSGPWDVTVGNFPTATDATTMTIVGQSQDILVASTNTLPTHEASTATIITLYQQGAFDIATATGITSPSAVAYAGTVLELAVTKYGSGGMVQFNINGGDPIVIYPEISGWSWTLTDGPTLYAPTINITEIAAGTTVQVAIRGK